MIHRTFTSCLFGLLLISSLQLIAQDGESHAKALRYHSILSKKPSNDVLFSRFFDTWLDEKSIEDLELFLKAETEKKAVNSHRLLSRFYIHQGREAEALTEMKKALESLPDDPDTLLSLAKLQARLLNFQGAVKTLEKVADDEGEISRLRGAFLARSGDFDAAIAAWDKAMDQPSIDEELMEDVIELKVNEGLYESALATAKQLIQKTKDPYLKAIRGMRSADILLLSGKQDEALERYTEILLSSGNESWIERELLAQIEQVFRREDNLSGLFDYFQELRKKSPRRVLLREKVISLMAAQGDVDKAILDYRELLKIVPGDQSRRLAFISFLEDQGMHKEALSEIKSLTSLEDPSADLYLKQASLQDVIGAKDEALASLALYAKSLDETPEQSIRMARIYGRFGETEKEGLMLKSLHEGDQSSREASEAYASWLVSQSKKDEALAIWQALAANAESADVVIAVARSLAAYDFKEESYAVLSNRMADYSDSLLFLNELCQQAAHIGQGNEAIEPALMALDLAKTQSELSVALKQAVTLVKKSEKIAGHIARLENKERTVAEVCLLAQLYSESRAPDRAEAILKAGAQQYDESELLRLQYVDFHEKNGDLEKAATELEALITSTGGRKPLYLRRLANIYSGIPDYDSALKTAARWKTVSPSDKASWTLAANLYQQAGRDDEALLELRRASTRFPENDDFKVSMANLHESRNEVSAAKRIFWRLYEESESSAEKVRYATDLARISFSDNTLEDLVTEFEKRARMNRSSTVALLSLSQVHLQTGSYSARRNALLEASRRSPNDLKLIRMVASVEERAGDFDRAVESLRRAQGIDKTDASTESLARMYLRSGDVTRGIDLLSRIETLNQDPRKIEKTALSMAAAEEWGEVELYLSKALVNHPDDWRLGYLYAYAQGKEFKLNAAIDQFLSLRTSENELQNVKAGASDVMLIWLKDMVPGKSQWNERAREALEIQFRWNPGNERETLSLPTSLHELRIASAIKIATFFQDLPTEERLAYQEKLSAAGLSYLEDISQSKRSPAEAYKEATEGFLQAKSPSQDDILRLLINIPKDSGGDREAFKKLLDLTKESNPSIGLVAAMSLFQNEQTFEQGTRYILDVYQSNVDLQESIINIYMYQLLYYFSEKSDKHTEIRSLALEICVDHMKRYGKGAGPYQNHYDQVLLQLVFQFGDAKLISEVISLYESFDNGKPSYRFSSNRGSFPPYTASISMNWNPVFRNFKLSEESITKLLEVTQRIENPLLQALFYKHLDKEELVLKALEKGVEIKGSKVEALFSLALFHSDVKNNPEEALRIFERLHEQQLSREEVSQADRALISIAQMIPDLTGANLKRAQAAVMRLRLTQQSSSEKEALVLAMTEFGLDDMAAKFTRKQQVSQRRSSSYSSRHRRSRNSSTSFEQLVKEGKRQNAARLAIKEVRAVMKQRNSRSDLQKWSERLKKEGMVAEVLALAHPGQTKSYSRRKTYASLARLFGANEIAITEYRNLLRDRPLDIGLDFDLIKLLLSNEATRADGLTRLENYADLKPRVASELNSQASLLSNADQEEYFQTAELLVLMADQSASRSNASFDWLEIALRAVATDTHFRRGEPLRSLFDLDDSDPNDLTDSKRREMLFQKLAEKALKKKESAELAFRLIVLARAVLPVTDEMMMAHVSNVVSHMDDSWVPLSHSTELAGLRSISFNSNQEFPLSALEYLAKNGNLQDWELLLETHPGSTRFSQFASVMMPLYKDFSHETFEGVLELSRKGDNYFPLLGMLSLYSVQEELTDKIEQTLKGAILENVTKLSVDDTAAKYYLGYCAQIGHQKKFNAFLDELTNSLGVRESLKKEVMVHAVYEFSRMLRRFSIDPTLNISVYRYTEQLEIDSSLRGNFKIKAHFPTVSAGKDLAKNFEVAMRQNGFLCAAVDIDPVYSPKRNSWDDHGLLLTQFIVDIGLEGEDKKKVVKHLKSLKGPEDLSVRMLIVALDASRTHQKEFLKEFESSVSVFDNWNDRQKRSMRHFLQNYLHADHLPQAGSDLYKTFLEKDNSEVEKQVAELLSKKASNYRRERSSFPELVEALVLSHPQQAAKVWSHTLTIARKSFISRGRLTRKSRGRTLSRLDELHEELLEIFSDNRIITGEAYFLFMQELEKTEGYALLDYHSQWRRRLHEILENDIDREMALIPKPESRHDPHAGLAFVQLIKRDRSRLSLESQRQYIATLCSMVHAEDKLTRSDVSSLIAITESDLPEALRDQLPLIHATATRWHGMNRSKDRGDFFRYWKAVRDSSTIAVEDKFYVFDYIMRNNRSTRWRDDCQKLIATMLKKYVDQATKEQLTRKPFLNLLEKFLVETPVAAASRIKSCHPKVTDEIVRVFTNPSQYADEPDIAIRLAALLGTDDELKVVTNHYKNFVNGDYDLLVALIEANRIDEAHRWVIKPGQVYEYDSGRRFTKELEENFPGFLKGIKDLDLRKYLRVLFATRSSASKARKPSNTLHTRKRVLGKQFDLTKVKRPLYIETILAELITGPTGHETLKEEFIQLAREMDFEDVIYQKVTDYENSPHSERLAKVLNRSRIVNTLGGICLDVQAGHTETYLKVVNQVISAHEKDRDEYVIKELIQNVGSWSSRMAIELVLADTQDEVLDEILPSIEELLKISHKVNGDWYTAQYFAIYHLLTYKRHGAGAFKKWLEQADKSLQERYSKAVKLYGHWGILLKATNNSWWFSVNNKKRQKFAEYLLTDKVTIQDFSRKSDDYYELLRARRSRLFKGTDYEKMQSSLKLNPKQKVLWLSQAAFVLAWEAKKAGAADSLIEEINKQLEALNDEALTARSRLLQARAYGYQKDPKLAVKILKMIDVDQLETDVLKKDYRSDLKKWSKKAEKK